MALQRVLRSTCVSVQSSPYKYFKAHYKVKKFVNFSRNLSFQCLWRFDYFILSLYCTNNLPHDRGSHVIYIRCMENGDAVSKSWFMQW